MNIKTQIQIFTNTHKITNPPSTNPTTHTQKQAKLSTYLHKTTHTHRNTYTPTKLMTA